MSDSIETIENETIENETIENETIENETVNVVEEVEPEVEDQEVEPGVEPGVVPGRTPNHSNHFTTSEDDDEDDNKLVTAEDLEGNTETPKANLWDDPEVLKTLSEEMESLGKVRFKKVEYTEAILTKALAEVLGDLGWKGLETFRETVSDILRGPRSGPNRIPFSLKTRNIRTSKMDFWLIRSFVKVDESYYSDDEGNTIPKKTVLMSRQFNNFLRGYCRNVLNDEVQFWSFTGSYKGKQHLDLTKLVPSDIELLPDQNPNNLVMVQFKMKTPEVMVGSRN